MYIWEEFESFLVVVVGMEAAAIKVAGVHHHGGGGQHQIKVDAFLMDLSFFECLRVTRDTSRQGKFLKIPENY
jgi:hypothetical protein